MALIETIIEDSAKIEDRTDKLNAQLAATCKAVVAGRACFCRARCAVIVAILDSWILQKHSFTRLSRLCMMGRSLDRCVEQRYESFAAETTENIKASGKAHRQASLLYSERQKPPKWMAR